MEPKTAVITGGTRGIGASLVKDFLRQGWNVAYSGTATASVEKSLSALSGQFPQDRYAAFSCDVRNEKEIMQLWENAVNKFGSIAIWVNNAGRANEQELFFRIPPEEIAGIIDTNVKGLMLATHLVYNNMQKQGSGAIYNMAGLGSDGRMITGLTPYGTSKRAVQYFTDAFAKEIAGSPVIIGTISPGMVLTDLTLSQIRKDPAANRQLIRIYNILANDPEAVTPYLVKRMIANRKNGAKISFLKKRTIFFRFLLAPFSKRDIVSKHLVMKSNKVYNLACLSFILLFSGCMQHTAQPGPAIADTILISDTIQYHPVRINNLDHSILPWFSADKGASYDTVLLLVWNFWNKMETDSNGLKYYMNHQVWRPGHDMRGLGGDQINMALSSWGLLYDYTGDQAIVDNMKYMADNYLERSLSSASDAWPFIPYPYNTVIHSGYYDGDMRNGKDITQPDKAGSFGYELTRLYKITGDKKYLDAAIRIAHTLSGHIIAGDSTRSPLPFRVNAKTGDPGLLFNNNSAARERKTAQALYTSNWTGAMMLFEELENLDEARKDDYSRSFSTILEWMKRYPLRTNKWGPFFEDIPGWSDTQTNAITFAMFIMQHRDLFPEWKQDVKRIIDWTYAELGNHEYEKYGVTVMNEQTVYRVPGNSHSSRQASVELLYAKLSGDTAYTTNAIRTLNWATYTVAADGRNRYIRDDIWLTDGYGDYVRHYLRAMAAMPELAPSRRNRLLSSSSVISTIHYENSSIEFTTFDDHTTAVLRLTSRPKSISVEGKELKLSDQPTTFGWTWKPLEEGGVLEISWEGGRKVVISL